MGYRSNGALWFSEEAKELLTDDLKKVLEEFEYDEENDIYTFSGWKWYVDTYHELQMLTDFFVELNRRDIKYDFIRIGEDDDDNFVATYDKFYINRSVGIY